MRLSALIICVSAFATAASATTLKVVVVNASTSVEIAGARVCVGTPSAQFKYGVAVVAAIGNQQSPEFYIPNDVITVNITVSKVGYRGQLSQITLSTTGDDIRKTSLFRLTEGSGGPTCNAAPAPALSIPQIPLAINSFQINGGQSSTTDRIVNLDVSYSGTATHYLVSESSDFSGASWKEMPGNGNQRTYNFDAYTINVPITISSTRTAGLSAPLRPAQVITRPSAEKYGTRTLHFRLKNAEFTSGKRSDTIELKPALKRYYVSGGELQELVSYAKEQGFTFSSNLTEGSGNDPCFIPGVMQFAGPSGFQEGFDFEIPGMKVMAHAQCDLGIGIKATVYVYPKVLKTTLFGGRDLNPFWRIKGNPVFQRRDLWNEATSDSSWTITKQPVNHDPSFTVEFRFTRKVHEYPVYSPTVIVMCRTGFCDQASIQFYILELEGPEDDNWVDPNKKWKNAFYRQ